MYQAKKKRLSFLALLLFPAVILAAAIVIRQLSSSASPQNQTGLQELASAHGLKIGSALSPSQFKDEQFIDLLLKECGMVTPENAMKWENIHPERDSYDFEEADALVAFAHSHDLQVRGHTLVWTNQLPPWLTEIDWSREQMIVFLNEHIDTLVGRYRGQVQVWDVVNETLTDEGEIAPDNFWVQKIGPEYLEIAFRRAHAADPQALLFYNDFNLEQAGPKADGAYQMILELLARGVPIHGIGFQAHTYTWDPPEPKEVAENMARYAALGLQVHITEMDVRMSNPPNRTKLQVQANIYGSMLQVCLEASNCDVFAMWGISDRYSWIPYYYPNFGHALPFDAGYQPKPAHSQMLEVLNQHHPLSDF